MLEYYQVWKCSAFIFDTAVGICHLYCVVSVQFICINEILLDSKQYFIDKSEQRESELEQLSKDLEQNINKEIYISCHLVL